MRDTNPHYRMCLRLTILGLFLDKLRRSSHPYERLCCKLFGMFGQKMVSMNILKQFLKFREHVKECLKIGRLSLS